MKLCTYGISRVVILTRNWAIKIPRINYGWNKFLEGIKSNRRERTYWIETRSLDVAPTIFSLIGLFNIQPRVQICETLEEIKNIPEDPWLDRKPDNLGYLDGRIVWVDYPYHGLQPTKNE